MENIQLQSRCTQGFPMNFRWFGEPACLVGLDIERACGGKLRSTHHIKWVDKRNLPPMFEMRWQGITLSHTTDSGSKRFRTLLIRMYYSEPGSNPKHFIGHHIHEKNISNPERTKILQNMEIQRARDFCKIGQESNWGIPLDYLS